jgi:hypothetical protein
MIEFSTESAPLSQVIIECERKKNEKKKKRKKKERTTRCIGIIRKEFKSKLETSSLILVCSQ